MGEEALAFVGVVGVDKASEGAAFDLAARSALGPPPFPRLPPFLKRSMEDRRECDLFDERLLSGRS